ncbi:hypothetical protein MRX96_019163 [Rhipicephalus microplus]
MRRASSRAASTHGRLVRPGLRSCVQRTPAQPNILRTAVRTTRLRPHGHSAAAARRSGVLRGTAKCAAEPRKISPVRRLRRYRDCEARSDAQNESPSRPVAMPDPNLWVRRHRSSQSLSHLNPSLLCNPTGPTLQGVINEMSAQGAHFVLHRIPFFSMALATAVITAAAKPDPGGLPIEETRGRERAFPNTDG